MMSFTFIYKSKKNFRLVYKFIIDFLKIRFVSLGPYENKILSSLLFYISIKINNNIILLISNYLEKKKYIFRTIH